MGKRVHVYFHYFNFFVLSLTQGLNPGTTYYYQVHTGNLTSPRYEFVAMKVSEVILTY
jgi:phosphodiesterase/alkaline phosphatase D-like protein